MHIHQPGRIVIAPSNFPLPSSRKTHLNQFRPSATFTSRESLIIHYFLLTEGHHQHRRGIVIRSRTTFSGSKFLDSHRKPSITTTWHTTHRRDLLWYTFSFLPDNFQTNRKHSSKSSAPEHDAVTNSPVPVHLKATLKVPLHLSASLHLGKTAFPVSIDFRRLWPAVVPHFSNPPPFTHSLGRSCARLLTASASSLLRICNVKFVYLMLHHYAVSKSYTFASRSDFLFLGFFYFM